MAVDDFIRTELDVPGMRPNLTVHAQDHIVVVCGARRGRRFRRELRLPREADMLNVHAHLADGVLTISAPLGKGRPAPPGAEVEIRPDFCACHPDAAPI
jgi:HSP20 family molecular chaperone IbpA